jgi:prepilin-type processing-associated H-X9-DG protein
MAYTGNAAIFPRNKFTDSGGGRKSTLVRSVVITDPSRTILATEFFYHNDWDSLMVDSKIKSHRPVTPFVGGSSGIDVYQEPDFGGLPRFRYPPDWAILKKRELGAGVIEDQNTALNAVGRHHPGGDAEYGGTANFVFVDGHVDKMTVLETVKQRLWGERFYSITGNNRVDPNPTN